MGETPNWIAPEFLDFINYNVCRAVSEHVGKEQAEKIYVRAGEIGYLTLKATGALVIEGRGPHDVLVQIAHFLEASGYLGRIEIERKDDRELQVDMYQVSVLDSSERLTEEGYAPSHFMTNLMLAALKDFGVTAKIAELGFERKADHVRERWSLDAKG